jgi:hypothetical protein
MNFDNPPDSFRGDLGSFAPRYRVDNSKTTLKEFLNLSGRPILGIAFWLAMRIGATRRLLNFLTLASKVGERGFGGAWADYELHSR